MTPILRGAGARKNKTRAEGRPESQLLARRWGSFYSWSLGDGGSRGTAARGTHSHEPQECVCECPVLWLSCENKLSFKLVLRANSFQLLIITEKETFKTRKLIHYHIVFLAPDILVPTCQILGKQ